MLIEANIFTLKKMIIDFVIRFIKINNYREIIIFINFYTRFEFVKRIVKLIFYIVLFSRIIISIIIIYINVLSTNRILLFKL